MAQAGIRELRNHLSRYLERVQACDEIVVTDRGRAITRVLPIEGDRTIDRPIREGRATPAKQRERTLPTPLRTAGTVSDLLAEQRR
ncbi:MAG: type II toxin-antitoxin system prevent-host-death family antitoxin [Actinomycetota bacterium]|nr:type II toxin-antitoxin system prevent-host-death family antitoxin [Actinomycetota bacterium]